MKKLILFFLIPVFALQAELTLENIWYGREFNPKYVSGYRMLRDGMSYCRLDEEANGIRSCNRYDLSTGMLLGTIFSTSSMIQDSMPLKIESFAFSSDESRVLITNGFESVYRHSGKSFAWVYELRTGVLQKVAAGKVMYPTLSPDGRKVAYVIDNNLFYFDLEKKREVQVTFDGRKNSIINGAVDWVYEEEFSMSRGFEWSQNSEFIAYYRFDETKVPEFGMDIYGSLYPSREVWKYPKAGEPNSKVDVYIYKLGKRKPVRCETGSENDQYLPRIAWMSPNFLSVQRLNRHQNKMEMLRFSFYYPKAERIYEETNEKYLEVHDWIFTDPTDTTCLYTAFFLSEKSGYNHIHGLLKKGGSEQLTKGEWDLDQFYGYNEGTGELYFSSGMDKPAQRNVYSIALKDRQLKQMTVGDGWNSAVFNPTFEYFLNAYSTMTTPPVYYIRDGKTASYIRTLEDNSTLNKKLEELGLKKVEFGSFNSSDNVQLDYWKIVPPDFDSARKYPVLFFVYGGPGYQTVKNQWQGANYLWYQYMAQKGYVVISIDNRGSGGRGEAFKKITYLNLGKYETTDYIEAAKYFGAQTWADKNRIGIFGWSYGGFMASNCITLGADHFKAAVAVAPVTNWRFYDNIYTERYMRTPAENPEGYDKNSPLTHVGKIKGNFLLIHGTADDNVHFQNAAEMVKAMNEQNIPYDAEYYPNTNHGIRGGKIRLHLFGKITGFLLKNL